MSRPECDHCTCVLNHKGNTWVCTNTLCPLFEEIQARDVSDYREGTHRRVRE